MSRYTKIITKIEVIGKIWMPSSTCAMVYDLSPYDVENIKDENGEITREAVDQWLSTHAGDFQHIIDFHADIDEFDSPWEQEESEFIFNDCMFPEE